MTAGDALKWRRRYPVSAFSADGWKVFVAGLNCADAVLIVPAVLEQPLKPAPERGGGYTLSAHVKQYYKTTLL